MAARKSVRRDVWRRFEYRDARSEKFWSIRLRGEAYEVHFGRFGSAGRKQVKPFASREAARKAYDKIVTQKQAKGYEPATPAARAGKARQRKPGVTRMLDAVSDRDLKAVRRLVEAGAPVNGRDSDGETPLAAAVFEGAADIVRYLVAEGADVEAEDRDGDTALCLVRASGRAIPELLACGANPNVRDSEGYAPLHLAVQISLPNAVQALVDAGADVDALDPQGLTAWQQSELLYSAYPHKSQLAIQKTLRRAGTSQRPAPPPPPPPSPEEPEAERRELTRDQVARWRGIDTADDGHCIAVRAPVAEVSACFAALERGRKVRPDVYGQRFAGEQSGCVCYQWASHPWTLAEGIGRDYDYWTSEQAEELSRRLATMAMRYSISSTAGAVQYELYDEGELIEELVYIACDVPASTEGWIELEDDCWVRFRSTRRRATRKQLENAFDFTDKRFASLDAYLSIARFRSRRGNPLVLGWPNCPASCLEGMDLVYTGRLRKRTR